MTADRRDGSAADRLRGASPGLVVDAIRDRDPLPGTRGFAGLLTSPPPSTGEDGESAGRGPDGRGPVLVRDVLGRQPLFVEADAADPTSPGSWSFDRTDLRDPEPIPAGSVASATERDPRWSLPTPPASEPKPAQAAVDAAIEATLSDVAAEDADPETGRLAVAFSGGVDSGLVAGAVPDAPCYVAGFEGCHDVSAAREAAAAMDRDLRVVEISHDDLRRAIPEIVAATGRRNPMDLNIAVPLYLTAEAAAGDGIDRLAVGQGADELFGGYSKVVDPADDDRVSADTVRGARTETVRTLPAQLERDVLALRAAGVEPVAPLLDDRVVDATLRLPGDLLATADQRKVALRRAAAGRVPESVRTADKKAVQYGTYVSREIDRLARRNGFKRRMENHVGQYVDALLEE
ncbi:asparagine synthase (glutamine-hydrolysing) [Halorubrum aquaticum]|uniref:Asparagine synthase (Glutamine-hydrolysing) n=1 Tax=Halorubrum aquaticum TaxID=387340 RepID=A0A1I3A028_9EURY|nr:asparagine synthase-related protein [Halorubrum aquaticum]SFH43512.1 asparagine synthase (glutamine-hydrolysing) [Halorubrum aquaticum]